MKADPVIVVSLVQELVHRSGIRISLKNRDENTLNPLLTFISKNVTSPDYAPILTTLFNIIIGTIKSTNNRYVWRITSTISGNGDYYQEYQA
jgi:hypothetical protein